MLCSAVQVFLLVLVVVVVVTTVDAGCQFSASLQTNRTSGPARDWVGRVREQFTQVGVHVVVAGNVIRVTSSDAASWRSYTVVCLQVVSSDRYLVAYEETGQRSARYSCLQFVRRSSDVIQIRAAAVSGRMDRAMCHDAALVLDRWLIFDRSRLDRHNVACPLHGGYSAHLFDKVDSQCTARPHRKRFPLHKNVAKKVDNARACGSQRRVTGVTQAVRTLLYFSASPELPAAFRRNCGAARCVAMGTARHSSLLAAYRVVVCLLFCY